MPPWLKLPTTTRLRRNAQLFAGGLNRLRHQRGFCLLRFVDGALPIGLDGEIKPRMRTRPHAKTAPAGSAHESGLVSGRQAEQVLLVAAHAVHQHQQPGMGRGGDGGALQKVSGKSKHIQSPQAG